MEILDADKRHPPRPDTPMFRHLTFTEIHAMELGLYVGLLLVWSMALNKDVMGFGFALVVARKIISHQRKKGSKTACDHELGFHDAVLEPHYFGLPVVIVVGAYIIFQLLF